MTEVTGRVTVNIPLPLPRYRNANCNYTTQVADTGSLSTPVRRRCCVDDPNWQLAQWFADAQTRIWSEVS
jgi:hypothetical protein